MASSVQTHTHVPPVAKVQNLIDQVPCLGLIGNTPMVRVDGWADSHPGVEIWAKVEYFNPGGSVKDRPVLRMLAEAIADGRLTRDKTIIDSSSGNAGIAYAVIGRALGYKVEIVIPDNASVERIKRLKAHGATVTHTSAQDGYDEAIRHVRRLVAADPDKYFYCDQYSNDGNWQAHYDSTAEEIWLQTAGEISHFVYGVGTGGVLTGVGRKLKKLKPEVQIELLIPEAFPGVEGLKPLRDPEDHIPEILDQRLGDRDWDVDVDLAWEASQVLAASGLFAGQSSGANVWTAVQVARKLAEAGEGGLIVTVLCDTGERYFSTRLWDA
ncbi:MAG TPA: cysteine synthase [Myxococcales bacterium]|nr:cysteine synthase [Myxococcales bacterium]HAN30848.1 cysteine synthase [Myxococcales bacterium]